MKLYGLIGHPLGHSYSKKYFNTKFEEEHLDCNYLSFDIPNIEELQELISQHPNLLGFNVTIPYKQTIIPYLNEIDGIAKTIQAVNTVKVMENGTLKGFNTDVIGFEQLLDTTGFKGQSALILGTGGASQAVQYVLYKRNIIYHLVSRDARKGDYTYESLNAETIRQHLLIINTTPLGMFPKTNTYPFIPYTAIGNRHTLIDLVYNPEQTAFLSKGKRQGAETFNGLTMLHAQAKASWQIWNNEDFCFKN